MAYASKVRTSSGTVPIGSNLLGSCSTGAGTSAKVVSLSAFDVLVAGVTIHVQFDNWNTAPSPTLKVGSTDAKPIRCNGSAKGVWESGSVVSFTYDGTYWIQNDVQESEEVQGVTYTLTKNGNTLTLEGDDGSTSSVTVDADTDTNTTYTLQKVGDSITLVGSDGSTSSVTDTDTNTNTTYSLSKSGDKIALIGSDGSRTEVTDADTVTVNTDTTYTLTKSGSTITLTGSDGTTSTVTDADTNTNTTYALSKSGSTITLTGSDGSTTSVTDSSGSGTDTNTTYTLSKSGSTITLTGSDGSTSSVTDSNSDTNTTYTLSKSGNTITLTGSNGSSTSVTDSDSNTTYSITQTYSSYYPTTNLHSSSGTNAPIFAIADHDFDNNTISAGGYIEQYFTPSKSGYKAIGIVGWNISNASSSGNGASYCCPFSIKMTYASTPQVFFQARNYNSNNSIKIKLTVSVLYIKT